MKRGASLLLAVAVLALGLSPAWAGRAKRTERTYVVNYYGPGSAGVSVMGNELYTVCPIDVEHPSELCVAAPVQPGERYVSVKFEDLAGQAVTGYLSQDINGDPYKSFGHFCGESEKPAKLPFPNVAYVQLWYGQGTCDDGTPSVVTAGKITLTFSNLP